MKKLLVDGKLLNNILFIFFLVIPFVTSIDSHATDNLNPTTGDMRSETVVPDQFTGTASYSIPIKVPFGRNNMNPNLALTYHSTNGNGWLGVGWDIQVGDIERAPKDISSLGTGFYYRRSGSVTALFENSAAGAGSYSPVIEGEFNRIQQLKATDSQPYWEVTSKAGVTYRYGFTSASRQDNTTGTPSITTIFKWCLDQIQDTNGNTITYTYFKDQGQIYLQEIDYTVNGTTTGPTNLPTNSVIFHLESGRFDAPVMFTTGFAVTTAYRVKSIDVVANTNQVPTRVRAYALGYNTATDTPISLMNSITGRSLLTSVTEYGSDAVLDVTPGPGRITGTSLPPITLGYQSTDPELLTQNGSGWTLQSWQGPTTSVPIGNQCVPGDFNGDGVTDLLCNNGNGSWTVGWGTAGCGTVGELCYGWNETSYSTNFVTTNPLYNQCMSGNFYGEGSSQLACYTSSGYCYTSCGNWNILYAVPEGSGWTLMEGVGGGAIGISGLTPSVPIGYLLPNGNPALIGNQCVAASFQVGDQTDIACYSSTNTWQVAHYNNPNTPTASFGVTSMTTQSPFNNNCFVGNFNGDGTSEFACFNGASGWQVGENIWADALFLPSPGAEPIASQCITGDFNGDGITDLACYVNNDNYWRVAFSTESGWITTPTSYYWQGPTLQSLTTFAATDQCITGDFNGDGITDLACYDANKNDGTWNVVMSFGSSWQNLIWSGPKLTMPLTQYPVVAQCFTGDFNGDGKTDIACLGGTGSTNNWNVALSHTFPTDLLSSVSNGVGGYTSIQYTPSTQYQNTQLPFPIQVVSNVTQCANYTGGGCLHDNWIVTNYTYSGGFYYNPTHEFRGFNYVKQTNPAGPSGEQTVTETWFHQGNDLTVGVNNPYVTKGSMKGKPYEVRVSDSRGNVISDMTTKYVDTNPPVYQGNEIISGGNPPYFMPPQEVDTYNCDGLGIKQIAGSATSQCAANANAVHTMIVYNSYDIYGNITREDRYGDVNNLADPVLNSTTVRSYQPNPTSWIVGLPASETVYQGIGTAGVPVSQTNYYYDDLASCNASPTNNQTPVNGKLTGVAKWLNGGTSPEVHMAYDSYGNLLCKIDAKGNITRTTYDPLTSTFPLVVTNALSQQTVTQYYGVNGVASDYGTYGQVKSVTDANNAATVTQYDVLGRKTQVTLPDNSWKKLSYNNIGAVGSQNVQTNTSAGLWELNYFDGFGRTVTDKKSGSSGTVETDTVYNVTGTVNQVSLPYYLYVDTPVYVTYSYDPLGRVLTQTNPDNSMINNCYANGIKTIIDANNHMHRKVSDVYGRMIEADEYTGGFSACTTTPVGPYAATTYTYDVLGNLRYVNDAKGNQTEMRYDTLNRKYYMSDPDMGVWGYVYDANSNLTSQTDAKMQTVTFNYDALNRLHIKSYPDNSNVTLNYDQAASTYFNIGRLTSMTDSSGSTNYNYDSLGRTTAVTKTIGGMTYNNPLLFYYTNGLLSSITYPDNDKVIYNFDAGGNLSTVGNLSNVSSYVSYGSYDALGRPGAVTYGNGITAAYGYDPVTKRLTSMTIASPPLVASPTLGNLISYSYGYDPKGNITSITDNLNTVLPTSIASDSYTLATGKAHTVGSANSRGQFQHDANGNITNDGLRTYTYNYDNMPTEVNNIGFVYDGNGTRVQKIIPNNYTTTYLDGLYECTNGYCDKHIYANGSRIAIKTASQTFYLHGDHQGSTSVVTDNSGNQKGSITYYSFGGTRSDNSSVYLNYKYTGQELDKDTRLYNYGARLYDPDLARFLTPDSIVPKHWNPQSLNRYAYVLNNPMNYTDPTGHSLLSDILDDIGVAVVFIATAVFAPELLPATAEEIAAAGASASAYTATYGCLAAEAVGGAVGGYSASTSGGNISAGVLFGTAVAGATAGIGTVAGSEVSSFYTPLVGGGTSTIGGIASGAVEGVFIGAGAGASVGYKGGKGTIEDILNATWQGAAYGAVTGGLLGFGQYYSQTSNFPSLLKSLTVTNGIMYDAIMPALIPAAVGPQLMFNTFSNLLNGKEIPLYSTAW
jgi:RHS repeat-associated protein